jgi:hypothetical protein
MRLPETSRDWQYLYAALVFAVFLGTVPPA